MRDFLRKFRGSESGSFAIYFALGLSLIFAAVGVAVETTRLASFESKTQSAADRGALAAAVYMTRSEISGRSLDSRKQDATKTGQDAIEGFMFSASDAKVKSKFTIDDETVTVDLEVAVTPVMAQMFGVRTLGINTTAVANIGASVAHDVDIALISDATGSMQVTLDAIQENMKDFTADLSSELTNRGIVSGAVRVKFIFYRDLMIDNHQDWTGPDMAPTAGLEGTGALYGSEFYSLPDDKADMDDYVDFFVADGGGSFKESGLEAIAYALNDSNWGDGQDTVRAIVLWTDAANRFAGDIEESQLTPYPDETYYWNDTLWEERIGSHFPPLTKEAREDYMFDEFAEDYSVASLEALKAQYVSFHEENSRSLEGIKTMSVNVMSNCYDIDPCGDWGEIATWPGVNYFLEDYFLSSSETYMQIVHQVADTVQNQLTAKDIAIKR